MHGLYLGICSENHYVKFLDLSPVQQVTLDWIQKPLVDLKIVPSDDSCPESWDDVFYNVWPGTFPYCDCSAIEDNTIHLNKSCDSLGKNECTMHVGSPPIVQNNLGGFKICGKRKGKPFTQVIRPDSKFLSCPYGTESCDPESLFTHPDEAICVEYD
jgi:hypothetical protein